MFYNEKPKLIIYVVLMISVFISLSGCTVMDDIKSIAIKTPPPLNSYVADELREGLIKKALILPFTNENGPERVGEIVGNAFAIELGKTGLFHTFSPSVSPQELANADKALWGYGSIDVDTLIAAKKKYGVDAFIFGKVTQYKAFVPLSLGIRVIMISGHSGAAAWSVEGVFDSDQKSVVQAAKSYYKKNYRRDQSLYGWELMLLSMERYTKFITNMLVENLVKEVVEE